MGILSNFIGGAAQAGGEILQRDRESATRRDEAQFSSDLAERRERAMAELRNQYQIDSEGRQVTARRDEETYQASPDRINQMTAADKLKAEGILGNRVALAPKTAEATQVEFDAGKGTRDAAQKEKLSFALDDFRQKSAAELEAEIKKTNDPKYLAGVKREADAKRDHSGDGERKLRIEALQIALDEKRAEMKMPPAVKEQAAAWREQVKAKTAIIDKAVAEGSATPEGLKTLEAQRDAFNKKIEDIYRPYLGDKAPKDDAKPVPANTWNDANGDVISNGKVIGKAKSAAEAKAMLSAAPAGKPQTSTTPAPGNSAPPQAGAPVDRLRGQPIGILTPLATIEEAAKAGNKQAAAYLERRSQGRADTESAPRTAAEMLNQ